jgi:hypothetical protein
MRSWSKLSDSLDPKYPPITKVKATIKAALISMFPDW